MRKSAAVALALAGVVAVGAALGGCVQQPPAVIPTSSPSAAPVFKTDAEALAAARRTYEGYLAASDAIAHDGGTGVDRISGFDTPRQYSSDQNSFATIQRSGDHTKGSSEFRRFSVQSVDEDGNGGVSLVVYACLDVSKTRVLDKSNRDVTPDRPAVLPLQLTFANRGAGSAALLLDGSDAWSGKNFCS